MNSPLNSPDKVSVDQLLCQRRDLWRARSAGQQRAVLATGHGPLDDALHDGGWPLGASTELLGHGFCWPLLLPALRRRPPGPVMLIDPPWLPSARWLQGQGLAPGQLLVLRQLSEREALWAADQSLRAGCCALVCQWLDRARDRDLRQLQLAAAAGGSWHLLLRPARAAQSPAPAALRLLLEPVRQGLGLQVLKQRGGWAGQQLWLDLWPALAALSVSQPTARAVHLAALPSLRSRAARQPAGRRAMG